MKKLPKSIPVLGKIHDIIEVTESTDEAGSMVKNQITINTSNIDHSNPDDMIHTLLHEFHHALTRRSGIYQGISEELDEVIADVFATALVEAFDIKPKRVKKSGADRR